MVFSADGLPFVRGTDVARILGLKSLHQFAKRHCKLRVQDIVYRKMDLPASVLKIKVLSVEEMLDLIADSKRKIARLLKFWFRNPEVTRILLPAEPMRATSTIKKALNIRIMVEGHNNTMTFQDFVEHFRLKTMEFYEEKAKEFVLKTVNINLYHDNLQTFRLPEPPKRVFVHFGDDVYEYGLM